MKILFATNNPGKIIEIKKILKPPQFEIISLDEAGIHIDVEEDGDSFEKNALKKAVEIAEYIRKRDGKTGTIVMADDSGLEIDCLNKSPGVHSARYLGYDTPYDIKNKMILDMIKDVSDKNRSARFVCVIACVSDGVCGDIINEYGTIPETSLSDKHVLITRGTVEGVIAREARGDNGFGYDPIFYIEELKKTLAEIDLSEKNKISHRGKALRLMKDKLHQEGLL